MHTSDINREWIEKGLHDSGTLPAQTRIVDAVANPIGTGQVADSVRVEFVLDGDAPISSVVAKVSSDDEGSRAAGRTELNYLREVRFYEEVAPKLAARVPECYYPEVC